MLNEIIKEYLKDNPFILPDPPDGGIRIDGRNFKYHFKYDSIEHFESRKPLLAKTPHWEIIKKNIQEGDEIWMLGDESISVNIIREGKICWEHGNYLFLGPCY